MKRSSLQPLLPRLAPAAMAVCLISATLQSQQPGEYQVKAVYLLNFGRFVEWPAAMASSDIFEICVIGEDPFGPALDMTLVGETIQGKSPFARRITRSEGVSDCHILFIAMSEEARLNEILAIASGSSALTVSDISQFARRGGMIQLTLSGNRVRFEVNTAPAEAAGLALSSELLKVAVAVRR